MAACLSSTRAIALSFGTFKGVDPLAYVEQATTLSANIVQRLWDQWGRDVEGLRPDQVDLYNVNIPMIRQLGEPQGIQVMWTNVWRNRYGQLFQHAGDIEAKAPIVPEAGPDAPPQSHAANTNVPDSEGTAEKEGQNNLLFCFAPVVMHALVNPDVETLPHGTDAWAIHNQMASVTPLRAAFAEPSTESYGLADEDTTEGHQGAGRVFTLVG